MKESQIYFLSGAVQSGKSTRLARWIKNKKNIDGILAIDKDGKRYLKHIASAEMKCLQLADGEWNKDAVWRIGAYTFSVPVFLWAQQILLRSSRQQLDWLVIDEAGLLELDGRGLEPALTEVLKVSGAESSKKIVVVVRERLVERMAAHFGLDKKPRNFTFPE